MSSLIFFMNHELHMYSLCLKCWLLLIYCCLECFSWNLILWNVTFVCVCFHCFRICCWVLSNANMFCASAPLHKHNADALETKWPLLIKDCFLLSQRNSLKTLLTTKINCYQIRWLWLYSVLTCHTNTPLQALTCRAPPVFFTCCWDPLQQLSITCKPIPQVIDKPVGQGSSSVSWDLCV